VRRWPAVLADAGRWGVAEALAYAVAAGGVEGEVPARARDRLRAAHEAGAASNAVLLAEAVRIQALLSRAGIPSVALKGTALVAAHYPLAAARHVGDLDLLVPRESLDAAAAALAPGAEAAEEQLDHDGHRVRFPAHLPALRTPAGVCVELHFAAPGDASGALAARILARPRQVEVQGLPLAVPVPEDCAAVACFHAIAGHAGSPVHLPRLVADLEAIDATAGLDWAAVGAAAGASGAPAVATGRALLDAARSGDVAAVFPGPLGVVARDLALPFLRGAVSSPRAALRTVLPSRRFMSARYGVPEGSPRLLLYYVARPFLAVRDRVRR
jgi:hypothetical protein